MYYMLESGKLDLAICYESEYKDISSLNCLPLHDRDLDVCVFMSKDHPLAQTDFTMEDLQSEPIGVLSIKNSIDFKVRMKDFFGYYGLQPDLTYQEYDSRRNLEMGLVNDYLCNDYVLILCISHNRRTKSISIGLCRSIWL